MEKLEKIISNCAKVVWKLFFLLLGLTFLIGLCCMLYSFGMDVFGFPALF